MENLQEKALRFLEGVGYLTSNCAYVKFNENEDWPIDYVRIDDVTYSNPKKLGNNIIRAGSNIREALKQGKSYKTIEDLGEHIDPFMIKYHPAWIYLRETTGLTSPTDEEILCACESKPDTFINHYKNNFVAIGLNVPYSDKINEEAPNYFKAHQHKAALLMSLEEYKEACSIFYQILKIYEPTN